eukprot:scaffold5160_cov107-Isochrysis_galbana.AAC.5
MLLRKCAQSAARSSFRPWMHSCPAVCTWWQGGRQWDSPTPCRGGLPGCRVPGRWPLQADACRQAAAAIAGRRLGAQGAAHTVRKW